MKRNKVLALTAAAVAGLIVASGPVQAQQKVTIDFWAHWASAVRRPTVDKIVANFNRANPNIQVNYTFVPFDQMIPKTLASVAAGNPPCVVVLPGAETRIRAAKNQLTDLSALGVASIKDRYFESGWNAGMLNGKVYALPFVTDTQMLFYNKAHFEEAGLPDRAPRTHAELEQFAAKLTKRNGTTVSRIGFHPVIGEGGLELWVQNRGGRFFDADGNPQVNSPAAVNTLQWFNDWSEKYGGRAAVNSFRAGFGGGAGPTDPFATGKVSMTIRNGGPFSAELAKNAPNVEFGMAPVPTANGTQTAQSSTGSLFTVEIPRGCKNPAEALKFAQYWTTTGAGIWAAEQNEMPGSRAAVASLNNPNALKVAANMKNTRIGIAPTFAPGYGSAINKAVDDVLIGGQSPTAALDAAQAAIPRMVADNK